MSRHSYRRRRKSNAIFAVVVMVLTLLAIKTPVGQELSNKATEMAGSLDDGYAAINKVPERAEEKAEAVTLKRVVDGDTIVVLNKYGEEEKIRLLSVNTPESVHADAEKNNVYGDMASDFTKLTLADYMDKTIYLTYDREKSDRYGRTLAYVWLTDTDEFDMTDEQTIREKCLNAILLEKGYAALTIYEPNHYYKDIFSAIEEESKVNGNGLWQYEEYRELVEE